MFEALLELRDLVYINFNTDLGPGVFFCADFKMDETIQTLIAIGAASAANCVPCIEHLYLKSGSMCINEKLIQEAVDSGSKVKTGASMASKSTIKELMSGEVEAEEKDCCSKASCC